MLAGKQLLEATIPPASPILVPDPSGGAQEEASARLRAVIGRLARRLRPTVAGSGLTPSQTSVLFTVVKLGPIRLSDLAQIEDINPTMLSRIAAILADGGLITRSADPSDRRSAFVEASAAGPIPAASVVTVQALLPIAIQFRRSVIWGRQLDRFAGQIDGNGLVRPVDAGDPRRRY